MVLTDSQRIALADLDELYGMELISWSTHCRARRFVFDCLLSPPPPLWFVSADAQDQGVRFMFLDSANRSVTVDIPPGAPIRLGVQVHKGPRHERVFKSTKRFSDAFPAMVKHARLAAALAKVRTT